MKTSTMLLIGSVAIVLIAALAMKTNDTGVKSFNAKAKKPLSTNEQPMYFKLLDTFPELVVLAQVSFSALMTSRTNFNRFSQKTADFVLCTKAFDVVAIVELDDSSHDKQSKKDSDKERDAMLVSVGHRVIRFKKMPNTEELLKAVFPPAPEVSAKKIR